LAQSFGLQRAQGALITNVSPDSPAERSDLRTGDIVLKVDKREIKSSVELPFVIGRYRPGDNAKMSVLRDGKRLTLKVKIGSRNGQVIASGEDQEIHNNRFKWQGATFNSIPLEIKRKSNIKRGVIVAAIERGAVYDAGIREGDIIQSIQLKTIVDLNDFSDIAAKLPKSGKIPILVSRPGAGARYVIIELNDKK
jgi:serine protease Do